MKETIKKYQTSPFFFISFNRESIVGTDLIKNELFSQISLEGFKILHFFINPKTIEQAYKNDFDKQDIISAIENKLILEIESKEFKETLKWENSNWSLPAYLTFSQLDIEYSESKTGYSDLSKINEHRKNSIKEYSGVKAYVEKLKPRFFKKKISLTKGHLNETYNIKRIFERRSCRKFSKKDVSFDVFSQLLYTVTERVRIATKTQDNNDEFYLLNSFYSWLNFYLVIQGVEKIQNGIYYYDALSNELLLIEIGNFNDEVAESIQNQNWIDGGGFCIYIVPQWERYMWIYRHSRAYTNLLIQLGEIGQEILNIVYSLKLEAWMTPAIGEDKAKNLFNLDSKQEDAMYFLKIGYPNEKHVL